MLMYVGMLLRQHYEASLEVAPLNFVFINKASCIRFAAGYNHKPSWPYITNVSCNEIDANDIGSTEHF
jgi:hypothetical protein